MTPGQAVIAGLLARERERLEAFAALLDAEQTALQEARPERLPDLLAAKDAAASALATALRQREEALAGLGLPGGRAGMGQWLDGLDVAVRSEQAASWQGLLQCAERCRETHAINGKLIAVQLAHTQQALTALLSASGQALTYGPDGQQQLGGGRRSLGSA